MLFAPDEKIGRGEERGEGGRGEYGCRFWLYHHVRILYYYVTKDNSMLFKLYCNLCSYNSFFLSVTYFAFDFEFKALARYPFTCPFIFDGCILKRWSLFTAWKCVKAPFLNKKTWRSITALSKTKHTLILKPKLYFTDSVVEWSRVLDLKSGGPWFKSSTLLLSGFVLGSPEFNSSTALSINSQLVSLLNSLCYIYHICLFIYSVSN